MATIKELEARMEAYKLINKQLSKSNQMLKAELCEKKATILRLTEDNQSTMVELRLLRSKVTEIVTAATGDFNKMQQLIARSASSFNGLVNAILPQSSATAASESNGGQASPTNSRKSAGDYGETPLRRVKPMIRTQYGCLVQNLSIPLPRLNESALTASQLSTNVSQVPLQSLDEDEALDEELENTATSLYSEEDEEEEPSQVQAEPVRRFPQPVRSHQLQVPEEFQDETQESSTEEENEPIPSTSYAAEPVPSTSYQDNGLEVIFEETENTVGHSEIHPQTPSVRRASPSNKENASPLRGFSNESVVASTPLRPMNPRIAAVARPNQLDQYPTVVLPRMDLKRISELNNIRISNLASLEGSLMVPEQDEPTEEEKAPSRKRKQTQVVTRRSTERPKRSRPAPGSLSEPSVMKKMRR